MRLTGILSIATVLAATSGHAVAAFQFMPQASQPPAPAPQVMAPAPQAMAAPVLSMEGEKVTASGIEMPLVLAVRQITPESHEFAFGSEVDLGAVVSWQSGKSWRATLNDILGPLGLSATEGNGIVYIRRGPKMELPMTAPIRASMAAPAPAISLAPSMPAPMNSVETAESPLALAPQPEVLKTNSALIPKRPAPASYDELMAQVGPAEANKYVPLKVVGLPGSQTAQLIPGATVASEAVSSTIQTSDRAWIVENGRTLQEILETWADAAGWNVVWNSERDYLIEASATFTGDFRRAAGELVRAFASAEPPIAATFYRNRTVVIEIQSDGATD